MRRADREITDRQEVVDILDRCDVLRLGLHTGAHPYVVPLSFGFEVCDDHDEGSPLVIWLHCAHEGSKLEYIKKDPRAGFEADCGHRLVAGDKACSFSMEYESVMGHGHISICDDAADKLRGLKAVMRHYAPDDEYDFSAEEISRVSVLKLYVEQITGKRLIRSDR